MSCCTRDSRAYLVAALLALGIRAGSNEVLEHLFVQWPGGQAYEVGLHGCHEGGLPEFDFELPLVGWKGT